MSAGAATDRPSVSVVIPGRDAARTLERCLAAVVPRLGADGLREVLFVDDGSTDGSAEIARRHGARTISGSGGGPGAARNLGWRAAAGDVVWFLDADTVAEPEALARLLPHLEDPRIAGVGGSYANLEEDSLLACLIHEEIRLRHLAAPAEVDHLGTFNALYRRRVLEEVGGFDESRFNGPGAPGAEDADLSYRVVDRGYRLRLEPDSIVGHHHPTRLRPYLRAQRLHGLFAGRLFRSQARRAVGTSYSGLLDHLQPPLALLLPLSIPAALLPPLSWLPAAVALALAGCAVPMTARLLRHTRRLRYLAYLPLSILRAFARALGLACSLLRR